MVIYVSIYEKSLEGLRQRGRLDLTVFDNTEWYVNSLVKFKTYGSVFTELIAIEQQLAADARNIVYMNLGSMRFRITRRRPNYKYYLCVNPPWMSQSRFCIPYNSYEYTRMLRPTKSLYTIVPTQMSSFI